nr:hypothetical protein [Parvularcula mediterranea]
MAHGRAKPLGRGGHFSVKAENEQVGFGPFAFHLYDRSRNAVPRLNIRAQVDVGDRICLTRERLTCALLLSSPLAFNSVPRQDVKDAEVSVQRPRQLRGSPNDMT